jgi:hypothetical protein
MDSDASTTESPAARSRAHRRGPLGALRYVVITVATAAWPILCAQGLANSDPPKAGAASGKYVTGTVLTPDGKPAAQAKVALGVAGDWIVIADGSIKSRATDALQRQTDESGHFRLVPQTTRFWLVVTHPSGCARVECEPDNYPDVVTLTRWARVEGTFRIARKPRPYAGITIMWGDSHPLDPHKPRLTGDYAEATDATGQFVFERVMPGPVHVGNRLRKNEVELTQMDSGQTVGIDPQPGQTTHVDLGAFGRPVIGQLRPPDGEKKAPWHRALVSINPESPELHFKGPNCTATVNRDGNFCFDDVAPGEYHLIARVISTGDHLERHKIKVPAINEKLSQRPVDLGILTLERPEAGKR